MSLGGTGLHFHGVPEEVSGLDHFNPRTFVVVHKSALRLWMKVASILAAALSLLAANEAAAGCHWTDRGLQARFILHGDEAVDAKTGLIWKRCSLGLTWDDRQGCIGEIARVGLDYALQKAKEAGWEWRVPSGPELQSIVDPACGSPVVDVNVFPDIARMKMAKPTTGRRTRSAWPIYFTTLTL